MPDLTLTWACYIDKRFIALARLTFAQRHSLEELMADSRVQYRTPTPLDYVRHAALIVGTRKTSVMRLTEALARL